MSQHILYSDHEAAIVVLDLPASIADAQATSHRLSSVSPIGRPYNTPEPKGHKRDALLSEKPEDEIQYHAEIQALLQNALTLLHKQWHEVPWCHPRVANAEVYQSWDNSSCLSHKDEDTDRAQSPPLVLSSSLDTYCCSKALTNVVVHNPHSVSTNLALSSQECFIVPTKSTFLCATIEDGIDVFEEAVRCLLPQTCFDLVLLDPPWTNRSVRHSRAYRSIENQLLDPFGQILPLVSTYLSDEGYLAVWITNKSAIRTEVLRMCSSRSFFLVEEWVWLKVTVKGEAVTRLDGVWRHPYEVLLMFRRHRPLQPVTRRVVVAVPDVHSRKPSLKTLFEEFLPQDNNVLEVFARSLTAGWWSWGDEVLKFQHASHWH